MDEVKLLPCRVCGAECIERNFEPSAFRTATTLWLCSNNKQLGGDCQLEWAFLTPEAWNRGSIHGLSPRPPIGTDEVVERVKEIAKFELDPRRSDPAYLVDYWRTAFFTVRDMARSAIAAMPAIDQDGGEG